MDFHRLADEYPLMPETELESLVIDMKTRGYDPIFPLVIFEGKILDGRNRFLAAGRAGVEPTSRSFSGDETKAREFVQSVNEHRRHLTADWLTAKRKERIERVATAHKNGQSTRVIAEAEGVSQKTVLEDLEKATDGGGSSVEPQDGKVVGKDGKKRAASVKPKILCERCKRVSPVEGCDGCKEAKKAAAKEKKKADKAASSKTDREENEPGDAHEPDAGIIDDAGHKIPDSVKTSFVTVETFREAEKLCAKLQKLIDEIGKAPGGEQFRACLRVNEKGDVISLKSDELSKIKRELKGTRPYSVCPICKGGKTEDCKGCSGRGWVSKTTWEHMDDAQKARLA